MLALVQAAAVEREADRLHDLHSQRALLGRAGTCRSAAAAGRPSCTAIASRISEGRRRESALNIASMSAVVSPGLNSSDERIVGGEVQRLAQEQAALSRTRFTTSSRCGAKSSNLPAGAPRASGPRRARRPWSGGRSASPGWRSRDRAGGASRAGSRPASPRAPAILACARSSSRVMRGAVSRAWYSVSSAAQLLAAHVRAATRHHHGGIPAQQRQRAPEGMEALELLLELYVRRGRHAGLRNCGGWRPVYRLPETPDSAGKIYYCYKSMGYFVLQEVDSPCPLDGAARLGGARTGRIMSHAVTTRRCAAAGGAVPA